MRTEAALLNLEQSLHTLIAVEHCSPHEQLAGLFYAITLSPFRITEMEILPLLFVAHAPEMVAEQTEQIVLAITKTCQAYKEQPVLNETKTFSWLTGFYQGLELRRDFWRYEDDGVTENTVVINSLTHLAAYLSQNNPHAVLGKPEINALQVIEKFAYMMKTEALIAQQKLNPPVYEPVRTGRNDPCPCGSGKKYKKCCA